MNLVLGLIVGIIYYDIDKDSASAKERVQNRSDPILLLLIKVTVSAFIPFYFLFETLLSLCRDGFFIFIVMIQVFTNLFSLEVFIGDMPVFM